MCVEERITQNMRKIGSGPLCHDRLYDLARQLSDAGVHVCKVGLG